MIKYAINYYNDFVLPKKKYLKIENSQEIIFKDLLNLLQKIDNNLTAEEIQTQIYEIGKKHNFANLTDLSVL